MEKLDHRHGTYAGAVAHWGDKTPLCDPCWTAQDRYRKRRKLAALQGKKTSYPVHVVTRRLQALHAIGWPMTAIATEAGVPIDTLRSVSYHGYAAVAANTAETVMATYERLCMTRPEGRYANRARSMAASRGWAPPLAWDDIDDPDETPKGVYRKPTTPNEWAIEHAARRLADLEHAIEHGHTLAQVCADLDLARKSILRWCQRNERRDIWATLARRSPDHDDRYTTDPRHAA